MGERPQQGWKETKGLEILQQEFVESGSVQCGYCTPAMILAARALLEKTLEPTEEQVREALSGVLCRCTAYIKPVQAVLKAAEKIRNGIKASEYQQEENIGHYEPKIVTIDQRDETVTIGKSEIKVDALKLVQGKQAFTADWQMPGMLYAKVYPHHMPMRSLKHRYQSGKSSGRRRMCLTEDLPRVVHSPQGSRSYPWTFGHVLVG